MHHRGDEDALFGGQCVGLRLNVLIKPAQLIEVAFGIVGVGVRMRRIQLNQPVAHRFGGNRPELNVKPYMGIVLVGIQSPRQKTGRINALADRNNGLALSNLPETSSICASRKWPL